MLSLGLDIGAISIKLALVADRDDAHRLQELVQSSDQFALLPDSLDGKTIALSVYRRLYGGPRESAAQLLGELVKHASPDAVSHVGVTGIGAYAIAKELDLASINEFRAVAHAVGALHPTTETIFEMGGENSKYIRLTRDDTTGDIGIADYEKNGDCAAGTGSFLDQQASRLSFAVEDIGAVVAGAGKPPTIAGRCSVFAKSDMIHAQQKGYEPAEILKGLCEAVAHNFKGAITKGKEVKSPIAFIGGVAANEGVIGAMRTVFDLDEGDLFVPPAYAWMAAIGAALLAPDDAKGGQVAGFFGLQSASVGAKKSLPATDRLSMDNVILLRDRVSKYSFEGKSLPVPVHVGIDIGSVSTNLVVLDDNGDLVYEIYTYTQSRPIQVVNAGLEEIQEAIGDKIEVRSVGTTGSGRELIGLLIGADTINDEITAHKTGASYVGDRLINTKPDTILEIGGQDSKFISLQDGIVVDFTMNEACAAGTGSFLEEQASKLGVQIKGEFARRALSSASPVKMGERCTVFMEKDVTAFMQQGATIDEICAGLAYSVALNYLNRVVRGRPIGEHVFFQGGTAYNDAVAAAFSQLLGKPIIVPPHNGVIGAIGMALLAREAVARKGRPTTFRGWNLHAIDYELREFSCKGCSNHCDIQQFNVEGEKTYWGDKCSDRYRKTAKVDRKPVIDDLIAGRMEALLDGYVEPTIGERTRVGIPRAMYCFDWFPFWRAYLSALDLDVVLSDTTSKQIVNEGIDTSVTEPCFPVKVAHGHVQNLLAKQVDYIWMPNMINGATEFPETNSYMCPWGQTMPFVLRAAPKLEDLTEKWLLPTLHPRRGEAVIERELWPISRMFDVSIGQHRRAVNKAYKASRRFRARLLALGQEALALLRAKDEMGIVLLGRPYNVHDSGVNLNIPAKLRSVYGANVIPMDCLPILGIEVRDINDNMYWDYGRKILQAARFVSREPNLRLIYITNFKCGPDSYIKHYAREAAQGPFLTLQFDGHANDAGTMTRCEAYLDSQGFFTHEPNPNRPSVESPLVRA
jgi:predicted CoA-substrate-specific enzyme activase